MVGAVSKLCAAREARMAATAPEVATHPLDPLTAREFAALGKLLRGPGGFGGHTIFSWVQLQEAPKEEVLAFKPGMPLHRQAFVVAISPEKKTSFEVVVDLTANRVVSTKDLQNLQPFLAFSEFDHATRIIDASPEVRAALEKRGFKVEGKISKQFWVDLYAPGEDPLLSKDGKTIRGLRALFATRQGGKNDYGPYLDGLMALVDLYDGKVIAVQDAQGATATRQVPHDVFNRRILGPQTASTPLQILPLTSRDLHLTGNHVRWSGWDFRYSFNQREGLVLHQIGHDDAGKLRSICYRASISEMLVPYADPSQGWVWREFYDAGEYGLGLLSSRINAGKELPANALTLRATLPTEQLTLSNAYPDRVFFYERDGGALFAHTQGSDGSRVYGHGKQLVVGFIATVGNYDYLYQWVFRQDATFGFEADLHGEILNRTVAGETCEVCARQSEQGPGTYTATGDQQFGTLVSPQIMGVYHQHWINLRMDFDIDGPVNAAKECNVKFLPADAENNPRGRAFTVEHTVFGQEQEAERNLDLSTDRSWVIYNPASRSPLGHAAGYELQPEGNSVSAIPESRFGEKSSFTQRHVWITKYDPAQLYASGRYPNQSPEGYNDDLFKYAQDNENIYKEDIVLWYSLGFTHLTRPEDYPIMPAGRVSVNFAPKAFFEKSPALGHARLDPGQ